MLSAFFLSFLFPPPGSHLTGSSRLPSPYSPFRGLYVHEKGGRKRAHSNTRFGISSPENRHASPFLFLSPSKPRSNTQGKRKVATKEKDICHDNAEPSWRYNVTSRTKLTSWTCGPAKSSRTGMRSRSSLSCASENQLLMGIAC